MTKRTYISRFHYGQEDISELENASLKVLQIFEKTKRMLSQYVPDSLWLAVSGTSSESAESVYPSSADAAGMFQKWVKAPGGWKFIGYETDRLNASTGQNIGRTGRFLQMIIWSLYEKIAMLHPILGSEPFFDGEELDVIANYFVPTYISAVPLVEQGKAFKTIQADIVLYQEHIQAPAVIMQSDRGLLEGNWMTGVNLDAKGFAGIRPYLKVPNGERAYMEADII
ncbi:hypothetical protein P4H67_06850 [Paenibacillus lautus]|uniref:hypothetical protein n=1 Tax=Paenibacillus lautus TaxID=1401 RepID=UPI002DB6F542|nr:hypothetical protein [Paenibacillus lautus]MEC0255126.1 hypothetical protein [Paenibacillus lautus]MEC0306482.1 hypothetical protein [Paenibacillus lautus]